MLMACRKQKDILDDSAKDRHNADAPKHRSLASDGRLGDPGIQSDDRQFAETDGPDPRGDQDVRPDESVSDLQRRKQVLLCPESVESCHQARNEQYQRKSLSLLMPLSSITVSVQTHSSNADQYQVRAPWCA